MPLLFLCAAILGGTPCDQPVETFRFDLGLSFSRFEQQVKAEVGGMGAEPLVTANELGFNSFLTCNLGAFVRLGVFLQLDLGSRTSASFSALDSDGIPTIVDIRGGKYLEFWAGPLLRLQYRGVFLEAAWGTGFRRDRGRTDLPNESGETDGLFRTSPRVAWLFALGGVIPLVEALELVLRVEYRIRYYTRRGGEALADSVVHGTQNITPFVGLSWTLFRDPPEPPQADGTTPLNSPPTGRGTDPD